MSKFLQLLRRSTLCSNAGGSRHNSAAVAATRKNKVQKSCYLLKQQQARLSCSPSNSCSSKCKTSSYRSLVEQVSHYSSVVSRCPSTSKPKAVIFDLGGVVIPSPQVIFDRFEEKWDLTAGSLVGTIKATGNGGSFAKMERGEYSVEDFCEPFRQEYQSFCKRELTIDQVQEFANHLSNFTELKPHQEVIAMFRRLKEQGIKVAILTNNFRRNDGHTTFPEKELEDVDVVGT